MRAVFALCLAVLPALALAQAPGAPPMPAAPQTPPSPQMTPQPGFADPSAGAPGYGGCNGCSYSGDYFGSGYYGPPPPARRPKPPLRLQGQWRNGVWYY